MESPAGLTAEICAAGNKCPWNTNDGMERASREERGRTDGRRSAVGMRDGGGGGGGGSQREPPEVLRILTGGEVHPRGDGGCRRKLAASFSRTARRGVEGGGGGVTGAGGE